VHGTKKIELSLKMTLVDRRRIDRLPTRKSILVVPVDQRLLPLAIAEAAASFLRFAPI
jgi:hypothetical protein